MRVTSSRIILSAGTNNDQDDLGFALSADAETAFRKQEAVAAAVTACCAAAKRLDVLMRISLIPGPRHPRAQRIGRTPGDA